MEQYAEEVKKYQEYLRNKTKKVQSAEELVKKTRTFPTQKQQEAAIKKVEGIFAKEKEDVLKEKIKRSDVRYSKVQEGIRKLKGYKTEEKGRVIKPKQPKFSKAVLGLTKAFLPEGAEDFESTQVGGGKGRVKEGRGRPHGTYKSRYVPGVGVVKVPTHVYNRMMAEAKAKRRLDEAKRLALAQQQMEAEQIAMSQDPRFQPSSEDVWADSEDMEHETRLQTLNQQQALQQQMGGMQGQVQPSLAQRGVRGIVNQVGRITLMGSEREKFRREGRPLPQQLDSSGRPQINMEQHRPTNPQISLLGGKSNLFSNSNLMNQRNELM